MSSFVKKQFLPNGAVKAVICGYAGDDFINYTKYLGIEVLSTKPNKCFDKRVSTHADLSIFHLGGNKIILHNQPELSVKLKNLGMEVTEINSSARNVQYPYDCILNCFILGQNIFAKDSITDKNISVYATEHSLSFANIKQGYAKCSTIPLDDNSFITDDISIYKKGKELGYSCILISKGDVKLDGFEYGFIGGCAFKLSKDKLAFFGDITKHRDYERIYDFVTSKGIKIEYLAEHDLYDVGSAIPIIEY